jgi:hypothetical protein
MKKIGMLLLLVILFSCNLPNSQNTNEGHGVEDSLDYSYEAGSPRVRIIDPNIAIVYYSWKMYWYRKNGQQDTINKEIGLMTLTAQKIENKWKWIAVTNQHTPWFYNEIEPVIIE